MTAHRFAALSDARDSTWRVDGWQLRHPTLGVFLVRVFEDGTACATRIPPDSKGSLNVEFIVASTERGVTMEDAMKRTERRIAELEAGT